MTETEVPLTGGNVAEEVVRVGDTVRKSATAATPGVAQLLDHLHRSGFTGAPRNLGIDRHQRHTLEYIPGVMADQLPPMTAPELHRLGGLIRRLHDVAATFSPPDDAQWQVPITPDREDLICHHDLAPWNLVRDGERWVFIDWDGAGPGSRLWDLGYTAHGFITAELGEPAAVKPRLRAFADGYGLDGSQRRQLPQSMIDHVAGMHQLLVDGFRAGRQPWARLYEAGHADYWGRSAEYLAEHVEVWHSALSE